MRIKISKKNRVGDHIWYVTNLNKFKKKYPKWKINYSLKQIISEIIIKQNLIN